MQQFEGRPRFNRSFICGKEGCQSQVGPPLPNKEHPLCSKEVTKKPHGHPNKIVWVDLDWTSSSSSSSYLASNSRIRSCPHQQEITFPSVPYLWWWPLPCREIAWWPLQTPEKNTTTGPISVRTKYDIGNPYDMEGVFPETNVKNKIRRVSFWRDFTNGFTMGLPCFVLQRSKWFYQSSGGSMAPSLL